MRNWFRSLNWKDIESDYRYKQADAFLEAFEPAKGRSYRWAYDYAIYTFDQVTDTVRALDRKAEGMIKYIGPGTGLLGLAVAWFVHSVGISQTSHWVQALIGVGILSLLFSMVSSLLSLLPHQQALPPPAKQALEWAVYSENDSEQALAIFAAGIGSSVVVRKIVAELKGQYLRCAYWFFIGGLLLIFAALFWSIIAAT